MLHWRLLVNVMASVNHQAPTATFGTSIFQDSLIVTWKFKGCLHLLAKSKSQKRSDPSLPFWNFCQCYGMIVDQMFPYSYLCIHCYPVLRLQPLRFCVTATTDWHPVCRSQLSTVSVVICILKILLVSSKYHQHPKCTFIILMLLLVS